MSLHAFLEQLFGKDIVSILYEYIRTIAIAHENALLALLPTIINDGNLEDTSSLVSFIYETPNHLDFVCRYLDLSISKFNRMARIGRVVEFSIFSLKKFSLRLHDETQRMHSVFIALEETNDERATMKRFWKLVNRGPEDIDLRETSVQQMGFRTTRIVYARKRKK
jgi:hypothetical protein